MLSTVLKCEQWVNENPKELVIISVFNNEKAN